MQNAREKDARPLDLPGRAPAILPRICEAAGWTQQELAQAVTYNLLERGNFNSLSAHVPPGLLPLPKDFPVFDVRPRIRNYEVEVMIGNERVICAGGGTASVTLGELVPILIMDSFIGKPVSEALGHYLLESLSFVITAFEPRRWEDYPTIVFTMPDCDFPT